MDKVYQCMRDARNPITTQIKSLSGCAKRDQFARGRARKFTRGQQKKADLCIYMYVYMCGKHLRNESWLFKILARVWRDVQRHTAVVMRAGIQKRQQSPATLYRQMTYFISLELRTSLNLGFLKKTA